MTNKTTVLLAMIAGFLGGVVSQHVGLVTAHAQNSPPQEVRAARFVIVDETGAPRGAFGLDKKGVPTMEGTDNKGQLYTFRWFIGGFIHKPKPSVIPAQ
jgi:hypothetical protein